MNISDDNSNSRPSSLCFEDTTEQAMNRSSLFGRESLLRWSIQSRGFSIVFQMANFFSEEEEAELMKCMDSLPLEEDSFPPSLLYQESDANIQMIPPPPPSPQRMASRSRARSEPTPPAAQDVRTDQVSDSKSSGRSTRSSVRCTSMFTMNTQSSTIRSSYSQNTIDSPGEWDIICGRNSGGHRSIGNRRFRVTVSMNMTRYVEAPTREAKTQIIESIVRTLQDDVGARFLKKINRRQYIQMNEKEVRNKVAHSMRDMVQEHRRKINNSNPVKESPVQLKRKQLQQQQQ